MSETMYGDAVMEKEKMGRDPTMLKGSSSRWELGVTKTGSPNEIRPSTNKCTLLISEAAHSPKMICSCMAEM